MQRRDLSKALLFASASGAAGLTQTAQAQTCNPPCYPVIAGENAANVFQTQYPPGDIRRYFGGETDWTAALARLCDVWKHGLACFIPAGTYPYTTSPQWFVLKDPSCGTSGHSACVALQLTGERGAILQHTGSGPAFTISSAGNGATCVPVSISNIIISGNANTTDGFYAQGVNHSYFRMIEVRNCTGKAFNIRFGVGNQFDTCFFSTNVFPSTINPAQGFCLDHDGNPGYYTTTCTFTNCVAEGFLGMIGCEIAKGSSNMFLGCSFEAVGIGVNIDNASMNNKFDTCWFEANALADVRILGGLDGAGHDVFSVGNAFINCNSISTPTDSGNAVPNISIAKGQATLFQGGFLRWVSLQSVSRDTLFLGTVFSNATGLGITGVGSYKMIGGTKADTSGFVTTTLANVP